MIDSYLFTIIYLLSCSLIGLTIITFALITALVVVLSKQK